MKLFQDVLNEADKHRVAHTDVHRVFFDAYQTHRNEHGSFVMHPHYIAKMHERYRFMHDEAIKYIEAHKKR